MRECPSWAYLNWFSWWLLMAILSLWNVASNYKWCLHAHTEHNGDFPHLLHGPLPHLLLLLQLNIHFRQLSLQVGLLPDTEWTKLLLQILIKMFLTFLLKLFHPLLVSSEKGWVPVLLLWAFVCMVWEVWSVKVVRWGRGGEGREVSDAWVI